MKHSGYWAQWRNGMKWIDFSDNPETLAEIRKRIARHQEAASFAGIPHKQTRIVKRTVKERVIK